MTQHYEANDRASTFVPHKFEENLVDLGEVRMNFVRVGVMPSERNYLEPMIGGIWR